LHGLIDDDGIKAVAFFLYALTGDASANECREQQRGDRDEEGSLEYGKPS
jgi:hypothetical protein